MRFDYQYVTQLLAPAGFVYRYLNRGINELRVTRKVSSDLFEQLSVNEGWQPGFRGYVIGGSVACAIVPGATFLKGMGELIPLVEIGPVRGWALIADNDEFRAWADRLAAIAPARAAELTERVAQQLLADTRHAREATIRFAERCATFGKIDQAKAALEAKASAEQLNAAKLMLGRPPVFVENGLVYYEVAALAMILFASELDEDSGWLGLPDPEQDRRVMTRLQILASRLAKEPGW